MADEQVQAQEQVQVEEPKVEVQLDLKARRLPELGRVTRKSSQG